MLIQAEVQCCPQNGTTFRWGGSALVHYETEISPVFLRTTITSNPDKRLVLNYIDLLKKLWSKLGKDTQGFRRPTLRGRPSEVEVGDGQDRGLTSPVTRVVWTLTKLSNAAQQQRYAGVPTLGKPPPRSPIMNA